MGTAEKDADADFVWKMSINEHRRQSQSLHGLIGKEINILDNRAEYDQSTDYSSKQGVSTSRAPDGPMSQKKAGGSNNIQKILSTDAGKNSKTAYEDIRQKARQSILARRKDSITSIKTTESEKPLLSQAGAGADALRAFADTLAAKEDGSPAADRDASALLSPSSLALSTSSRGDPGSKPESPSKKEKMEDAVLSPKARNKGVENKAVDELEITLAGLAGRVDKRLEELRDKKRQVENKIQTHKREAKGEEAKLRTKNKRLQQGPALLRIASTRTAGVPRVSSAGLGDQAQPSFK
jgi:hypothetical protein